MPELICAADDSRWQDERRRGVTATDIVTILGLSGYDSAYSLYWRKRGDLPATPDNDRFRLGRHMERYVVERFEEVYDGLVWGGGLFRSSTRPWQFATLDRTTGLIAPTAFTGLLECKSWADADRHAWDDTPPPAVRAQVLWQMDVMDVSAGHVGVVFLPSGEFCHYTIEHCCHDSDPARERVCEICQDIHLMRAAGEEFWRRVAGELPPPDVDGSAATLAAVRARFPAPVRGKAVPVDGTLWAAWSDTKDLVKQYEGQMRAREAEIRELLGEGTEVEVDGQVVARRVISKHSGSWTQDCLRRVPQKGGNDD